MIVSVDRHVGLTYIQPKWLTTRAFTFYIHTRYFESVVRIVLCIETNIIHVIYYVHIEMTDFFSSFAVNHRYFGC
jgi:hypothetical protein